jgi:nicotinate phosphoribosyltransferase
MRRGAIGSGFSLRRTHGIDAGMKVARSSYLAGFAGTSNVRAGQPYGIPIVGTMAHSFVSSFEHEIDAFRAFVTSFPNHSTLLIDTYDTLAGARKAVQVAKEMAARGQRLQGVRIDSGDLAKLAAEVRKIFDEAGLKTSKSSAAAAWTNTISLIMQTLMFLMTATGRNQNGSSADAPWSDVAYKLVEYDNRSVLLSTGKSLAG